MTFSAKKIVTAIKRLDMKPIFTAAFRAWPKFLAFTAAQWNACQLNKVDFRCQFVGISSLGIHRKNSHKKRLYLPYLPYLDFPNPDDSAVKRL
jgi:hypothetical protein